MVQNVLIILSRQWFLGSVFLTVLLSVKHTFFVHFRSLTERKHVLLYDACKKSAQKNLILVAKSSSESSYEPARTHRLARALASRIHKLWK